SERHASALKMVLSYLQSLIEDRTPNSRSAPDFRQNPRIDFFEESWNAGGKSRSNLQHISDNGPAAFGIRYRGPGIEAGVVHMALEDVRERKKRNADIRGLERHPFTRCKDVRHQIPVRQHCTFRRTGGTRSIDNGGQFLRIDSHGSLTELT